MALGLNMSWQIEGGRRGSSDRFYFLGLQNHRFWICDRSHEIKGHVPWKESCDKPRQLIKKQRQKKSRDITLPTKARIVKAMVFPVVMYGCESWTIKKAEYERIDTFKLWCCRRFFRVLWTARSSN